MGDSPATPRAGDGTGSSDRGAPLAKCGAPRFVADGRYVEAEDAGVVVAREESIGAAVTALASWREVRANGHRTLLDVLPAWLERRELDGVRDMRGDRSRVRAHLEGHAIARLPLVAITPADVRQWIGEVTDKPVGPRYRGKSVDGRVSRQTVKNALYLLTAVLRDLHLAGVLDTNPADGMRVRVVRRVQEPWTYLTREEIERVRAVLAEEAEEEGEVARRAAVVFDVLIGAGFRVSELVALRWGRIERTAHGVIANVVEGSPGRAPKSAAGRRPVPIFGHALAALDAWRAHVGARADVPEAHVFEARSGAPHDRQGLLPVRRLRSACKRAGIDRRVRVHDLRHTCGAALVSGYWGRRWSLEEVRAMLGHSTIRMTERYAHLAPSLVAAAAREAAEAFRGG